MPALTEHERMREAFILFRKPLMDLYAAMDHAYRTVAGQLDFVCSGCAENCCRSLFYHYTYLEYVYLESGLNGLEPMRRMTVNKSAAKVREADLHRKNGSPDRPLCPLHLDGRCSLYPYRPMICRLHGVPSQLERPGQGLLLGPGCETFERGRRRQDQVRLDRTPYYRQLAELELKFKKEAGIYRKIRMTIAEMIGSLT